MYSNLAEKWNTYWDLMANQTCKFEANLINIPKVINDFTHKTKLNFCHTYRLNQLKEQAENRDVARCLLVVKNGSNKRLQR